MKLPPLPPSFAEHETKRGASEKEMERLRDEIKELAEEIAKLKQRKQAHKD